jgi:uncharacterized protein (DUF779 family)
MAEANQDHDAFTGAAHASARSVTASPAAVEAIERLTATQGQLIFVQSGGCCEGSSPMCLRADELVLGLNDRCLGEIGGAPFYIDAEQYERWLRPRFEIDVAPGAAEGFSLEGLLGVHFITRTATPRRLRTRP